MGTQFHDIGRFFQQIWKRGISSMAWIVMLEWANRFDLFERVIKSYVFRYSEVLLGFCPYDLRK
jgi:hypothetical protein